MYRSCAYPGCPVRVEACRIHHVHWWDHNGRTDLHNLVPLCSIHHHLVHEGGWTLTLHPDRTITLHRPDGTLFFEGTTVDRTTRGGTTGHTPPRPEHEPDRAQAASAAADPTDVLPATTSTHVEATPRRRAPPPRAPAA